MLAHNVPFSSSVLWSDFFGLVVEMRLEALKCFCATGDLTKARADGLMRRNAAVYMIAAQPFY